MSMFSERLRLLRKESRLSQQDLASIIGISKSSINMYERGEREPKFETMEAFADHFNVDMDYLYGRTNKKNTFRDLSSIEDTKQEPEDFIPGAFPVNDTRKIPVLGCIAAGEPLFAEENIEGYIWTDRNGGSDYFALRVRGNSMNAVGIKNNDIVIIRKQETANNGDVVAVLVDDEATIKEFRQEGGTVALIPLSTEAEYKTQLYSLKEHQIKIIGRIVESRTVF